MNDCEPDYPTDIFGERCFRFFVENTLTGVQNGFGTGISNIDRDDAIILFWDVALNGRSLHNEMTKARADMSITLINRQPQTGNEKLVCAELIEMGAAEKADNGIRPNFPYLTKEQGDELNNMIEKIGCEIGQNVLDRTDVIRKILREHTPAHLTDYTDKMSLLLHYREVELIMQSLCESGWLLPWKSGMLGTTVVFLK